MIKLCVTEKNNAINPVYTQRQQFSITVNTDFQRINENVMIELTGKKKGSKFQSIGRHKITNSYWLYFARFSTVSYV